MKKVILSLLFCSIFSLFSFNTVSANNENLEVKVKKNEVNVEQKESAVMTYPALGGIIVGDPFPFLTFITWF